MDAFDGSIGDITRPVAFVLTALAATVSLAAAPVPREISFPTADGGTVVADLYGDTGRDAVVLAHGAAFDRASWRGFAAVLVAHGYQVLAIDFRGYGKSKPGSAKDALFEDVLAAVRYLRRSGAPRVSVVGASMGGGAVLRAAAVAAPGEIDRVVLLSPAPTPDPAAIKPTTLFIASRDEPAIERIREQFARAREPKRLVLLPGSAHAQHIFDTDQADALRTAVLDFLASR